MYLLNKGLFYRIIFESGIVICFWVYGDKFIVGRFVKLFGLKLNCFIVINLEFLLCLRIKFYEDLIFNV